jgi:hypothetical protein
MGREPGADLMRELEGRAEAVAGTFNAQDVATTLWAYATMGWEPGAGMIRELEGRAEAVAGTFKAQEAGSLPAEAGSCHLKRWEVVNFFETMRSDGSLAMTLRLKRKRKRAADEDVKKAPTGRERKKVGMGEASCQRRKAVRDKEKGVGQRGHLSSGRGTKDITRTAPGGA